MKTSLQGKYEHDKLYVHEWQTVDGNLAAIVMSGHGPTSYELDQS